MIRCAACIPFVADCDWAATVPDSGWGGMECDIILACTSPVPLDATDNEMHANSVAAEEDCLFNPESPRYTDLRYRMQLIDSSTDPITGTIKNAFLTARYLLSITATVW